MTAVPYHTALPHTFFALKKTPQFMLTTPASRSANFTKNKGVKRYREASAIQHNGLPTGPGSRSRDLPDIDGMPITYTLYDRKLKTTPGRPVEYVKRQCWIVDLDGKKKTIRSVPELRAFVEANRARLLAAGPTVAPPSGACDPSRASPGSSDATPATA